MSFLITVVAIVGVFLILLYNTLVGKRNRVENTRAFIDTELKKRFDLVPNLVAAVKGYADHERETLVAIAAARTGSPADEAALGHAIAAVCARAEAYPELKASANFQLLMRNLTEIEEQLSAARRTFNMAVTSYNTAIAVFPANLFAGMLGFRPKSLFEINENEAQAPKAVL